MALISSCQIPEIAYRKIEEQLKIFFFEEKLKKNNIKVFTIFLDFNKLSSEKKKF